MNRTVFQGICILCLLSISGTIACGKDVVLSEDFNGSAKNWANFNSSLPLNYSASGGPDGGSYASGPRVFNNLTPGNTTIILRARHDDPWSSSNDAFRFDWFENDVTDLTLSVRHNYTLAPLTYIMRVATEDNQKGHVYQASGSPVPNGQWTPITFDVSPDSPYLLSTEGNFYTSVFSNIGFVTIGVFVPSGLPTNPDGSINSLASFTFDIDKVTVLSPEPTSAAIGLIGMLGGSLLLRRRGR